MVRYFVDPILALIKDKEYVFWDGRKYCVDLSDKGKNPDPGPDEQYSYIHRGSIKTWANSKEKGRLTLMEMILKDELTKLSQYGGKPAFSAELKLHKEYKLTQNVDTPWIQIRKDGTCYVNLENTSLVPTKNTTSVASEDEIKKWEEASQEKKKVIVDDVLKALKRTREKRESARRIRRKNKNSTKKKSAKNTPPAEEGSTIVNQFIFGSGSVQGTVVLDSTGRSSEQMRGLDAGVQNESISSSTTSSRSDESVASPLLAAAQLSAPQGSTIVMNDITFEANSVRGTVCNGDTTIVQQV